MTKINFSLKIVKQTKKHSSIFVRTRKKAYQASCLCSLFISSSLEDINRCKGKGRHGSEELGTHAIPSQLAPATGGTRGRKWRHTLCRKGRSLDRRASRPGTALTGDGRGQHFERRKDCPSHWRGGALTGALLSAWAPTRKQEGRGWTSCLRPRSLRVEPAKIGKKLRCGVLP